MALQFVRNFNQKKKSLCQEFKLFILEFISFSNFYREQFGMQSNKTFVNPAPTDAKTPGHIDGISNYKLNLGDTKIRLL